MGLIRTIDATTEPVTVSEAIDRLRLDTSNAQPHPTAPTVALLSPAAAGNVDNGAHRYRVTFVTADGETDGGDISDAVTVADKTVNGKVRITNIQIGGSGITSRKLYRTVAGGSSYFLLATIADNTTTAYTDNIADSALGAGIPSVNGTVDPLILPLITAAREWVEGKTGRALITQTWRYTLDEFPRCHHSTHYQYNHEPLRVGHIHRHHDATRVIAIPQPKLISIESVTYLDANGDEQVLAEVTDFVVDADSLPGRIVPAYGKVWPVTRHQLNAVTVVFKAGYGDASAVPRPVKEAILLVVNDLYRNRESQFVGASVTVTANPTVDALLQRYLFREFN